MRLAPRLAALALLAVPAGAPGDPALVDALAPGALQIPGTRVRLEVPAGFEVAKTYAGLIQHLTATTVVVRELGVPPEAASAWLEDEALLAHGLLRTDSQTVDLPEGEALVVHATEDREYTDLRHWIALFGDSRRSVLIVATAQDAFDSGLHPVVMKMLGSARWQRDEALEPLAGLGFRVSQSGALWYAPRLSDQLLLVRPNQLGPLAGDAPRAIVSRLEIGAVDDLDRLALEHLSGSDQTSTLSSVSSQELSWDGLPAREIVAHGTDFERHSPLVLYQMLALDGKRLYVLQGFAPRAEQAAWLPRFRELAQSFRRLPAGDGPGAAAADR